MLRHKKLHLLQAMNWCLLKGMLLHWSWKVMFFPFKMIINLKKKKFMRSKPINNIIGPHITL